MVKPAIRRLNGPLRHITRMPSASEMRRVSTGSPSGTIHIATSASTKNTDAVIAMMCSDSRISWP